MCPLLELQGAVPRYVRILRGLGKIRDSLWWTGGIDRQRHGRSQETLYPVGVALMPMKNLGLSIIAILILTLLAMGIAMSHGMAYLLTVIIPYVALSLIHISEPTRLG